MPNPAASPAVSSTVGLKNMVIAPLTVDTEETLTYGELQLVAGAIEASITPQNADPDVQFADDVEFDVLYPDPELSFKTKMADLPLIIQEILTAQCIISNPNNIHTIASYLKGSGKVTFANRPGGFYYARIVNQIPFEKILRGNPHRSFAVNFRCQPFWYPENVPVETLTASTSLLNNPGSVYSEPTITVYGSGEITLMVGTQIVELTDIEDSITLNTSLMEAYKGNLSMNSCMSGEFPVLKPGANAISRSGNVTKVEVQPNWRYL